MFGVYERDNSSFEHFFWLVSCQMHHVLAIETTSEGILARECKVRAM